VSTKARFFKKVQQNNTMTVTDERSVEADIQAFCRRMDDFARQVCQWFEGSGIEVIVSRKYLHDLSTIGFSLNSGSVCYEISTITLRHGLRSVTIMPEQLWRAGDKGCVTLTIDTAAGASGKQKFYLRMAPERGWLIRDEGQASADSLPLTEEVFFQTIESLA
jgi:hypothetical protein